MQPIFEQRKLERLAHHVLVEPNEDKVTTALKLEPTLVNAVLKKIKDNSGRIFINNTLFQLAFGAGDPEMCLAVKPSFVEAYRSEATGIEEMERQRNEKFAENNEFSDIT